MNTDRPRIRKKMMAMGLDVSRGEYEELVNRIRAAWRRKPHKARVNIEGFVERQVVKAIAEKLSTSR